jgi:hypothetical protein
VRATSAAREADSGHSTGSKPGLFITLSTTDLTRTGWGQTRACAVRGERLHYIVWYLPSVHFHSHVAMTAPVTSFLVNALCFDYDCPHIFIGKDSVLLFT